MAHDDFSGLVALVTGAASGIGLATASLLAERGARVAALDRSTEGLDSGLLALRADVTDSPAVQAGVEKVVESWGRLDVVVNNAGIGAVGTVEDNSEEEWHRVFNVNVVGMARVARAALPHLRRSQAAAIVNTCSIAATAGLPQRALYSATKGAVYSLTLAMAADLVADRVRVTCVCPGTVDTPWVARLLSQSDDPATRRSELEARQPWGRLGTSQEVAAAIAYLASPESGFLTGCALAVDGGMNGLRLPRR